MIATNQDRAIHVAYSGNDEIGRIDRHNIAKKYDRVPTIPEHLCNRIGNVVVEQEMQAHRLDAGFSWLCAQVAAREKSPWRYPLVLVADSHG